MEAVLHLVAGILRKANFSVLTASGGAEAVALAGKHKGTIDLLLTDIEMPDISGFDLGIAFKESRPHIHIMLMSGQKSGDLLVLNYGWNCIQKPFIPTQLVEMVRSVLKSPDKSQGSHRFDSRADEKAPA
jgi:DNA-binding response OmpR family regulator